MSPALPREGTEGRCGRTWSAFGRQFVCRRPAGHEGTGHGCVADLPGDLARPTPPVPAAEDEDGLLPIEQSLASALWTRWADPEGGPVIVIMDDPRTVARSLREWLAANTRPDPAARTAPEPTSWHATHWHLTDGRCVSPDDEVTDDRIEREGGEE